MALSRKEQLILKSYEKYFPNLEKACDMAKIKLMDVVTMMDDNYTFKIAMEAIKVKCFSLAEQTLIGILSDSDSSTHHKITASKAILQYKTVISKF